MALIRHACVPLALDCRCSYDIGRPPAVRSALCPISRAAGHLRHCLGVRATGMDPFGGGLVAAAVAAGSITSRPPVGRLARGQAAPCAAHGSGYMLAFWKPPRATVAGEWGDSGRACGSWNRAVHVPRRSNDIAEVPGKFDTHHCLKIDVWARTGRVREWRARRSAGLMAVRSPKVCGDPGSTRTSPPAERAGCWNHWATYGIPPAPRFNCILKPSRRDATALHACRGCSSPAQI